MRIDRLRRDERGIALLTVLSFLLVVGAIAVLLTRLAISQLNQSDFQEREDVTIAGTEAILERYAAKMTLDPLYYAHRVDEAERTRVCDADPSIVRNPGEDWDDTCTSWSYIDPPDGPDADTDPDWWVHPLFDEDGLPGVGDNDVGVLIEVTPPSNGNPIQVEVVGRLGDRVNTRSISAAIDTDALSEFVRVTQADLSYGSGANITGKIYSGDDLNFHSTAWVYDDIHAEDEIQNEPNYGTSAASQAYDGRGEHNDIRDVFPNPLDFDSFWDDLTLIRSAACGGGGLCFDDADARAWMLHFYEGPGGEARVHVWKSDYRPPSSSRGIGTSSRCISREEYWMIYPQTGRGSIDFDDIWDDYGDYAYPANGAIWTNDHTVIGNQNYAFGQDVDGDGLTDNLVAGSATVYAGTTSARRNIIVNADIYVQNWPDSFHTLGLIGSDEFVLNPRSTGGDNLFTVTAALLAQNDKWRVARNCGTGGSNIVPPGSTLDVFGSLASRSTGSASGTYSPRNYNFDDRLSYLRPPLYPLLNDRWEYVDWEENPLPTWVP